MKIITFSKEEKSGGAARAAYAWHTMLLKHKVDATYLVENQQTNLPSVISTKSKFQKLVNMIRPTLSDMILNFKNPKRKQYPWGVNLFPTHSFKMLEERPADLINFHWISRETISWKEIAKINKPIVWTMHDMWAMTGGCHYTYGCEKYKTHCGDCPQLQSNKLKDTSYKVFEKKIKLLKNKNITILASSKWLYNCFKSSTIFKDFPIYQIPNPINTEIFKPIDKSVAKNIINLSPNKKAILFMAFAATTDERKGFQFLPEMIKDLEAKYSADEVEFVVVGDSENRSNLNTKFDIKFLGTVSDDWSLALIYSACESLIAPSMQENLSNAVMEALACGTPVVAFNIGGMPDMIVHQHNGYLATPFKADELAKGIQFVFEHNELKANARKFILDNFTNEVVFQKLFPIYNKILKNE